MRWRGCLGFVRGWRRAWRGAWPGQGGLSWADPRGGWLRWRPRAGPSRAPRPEPQRHHPQPQMYGPGRLPAAAQARPRGHLKGLVAITKYGSDPPIWPDGCPGPRGEYVSGLFHVAPAADRSACCRDRRPRPARCAPDFPSCAGTVQSSMICADRGLPALRLGAGPLGGVHSDSRTTGRSSNSLPREEGAPDGPTTQNLCSGAPRTTVLTDHRSTQIGGYGCQAPGPASYRACRTNRTALRRALGAASHRS